jgi:nitrate reductase beta subunit
MKYRVALPLHPEFRTLPMVWYIPPLSPVLGALDGDGRHTDPDDVFPAIDTLRIPVQYLANLLTAGDTEAVRAVLKRLAAMRGYMRRKEVHGEVDAPLAADAGMTPDALEDLYRLLAIAKYDDRYVIPKAHAELADRLMVQQGARGLGADGQGIDATAPKQRAGSSFMLLQMAGAGAQGPTRAPREADGLSCACGSAGCGPVLHADAAPAPARRGGVFKPLAMASRPAPAAETHR